MLEAQIGAIIDLLRLLDLWLPVFLSEMLDFFLPGHELSRFWGLNGGRWDSLGVWGISWDSGLWMVETPSLGPLKVGPWC